jgi:hypothetical protein
VARGVPTPLCRRELGRCEALATGLFQATQLTFIVAAVQIGTFRRQLTVANGAALIGGGMLSVMLFPLLALSVLGGQHTPRPNYSGPRVGMRWGVTTTRPRGA